MQNSYHQASKWSRISVPYRTYGLRQWHESCFHIGLYNYVWASYIFEFFSNHAARPLPFVHMVKILTEQIGSLSYLSQPLPNKYTAPTADRPMKYMPIILVAGIFPKIQLVRIMNMKCCNRGEYIYNYIFIEHRPSRCLITKALSEHTW